MSTNTMMGKYVTATKDSTGNVVGLSAGGEHFSEAETVAYVDFTSQPNGDPAAVMDTGQTVDFINNSRKPLILNERLVVDAIAVAAAGVGSYADYYQADLGAPVTRVGVEYTQPAGADTGTANMTYAAWNGNYQAGIGDVPKSWVHMSIVPGTGTTGTANYFVCNGIGNLFEVKEQTFLNPVADGSTPWFAESILDVDAGMSYSFLPDGSIMTVSNAEIAAMCTSLSIAVVTFDDLASNWIVAEHFSTSNSSTAKFGEFKALFGETENSELPRFKARLTTLRRLAALMSSISTAPSSVLYAPTTQLSAATTTSAANVDATNVKITARAGATGKLAILITAYYEWSANDVMFWRLGGTVASTARAAHVGVSGEKGLVTQLIVFSGLTPGQTLTETLQHWTVSSGSATCKAGGSGGSMVPPITFLALPG